MHLNSGNHIIFTIADHGQTYQLYELYVIFQQDVYVIWCSTCTKNLELSPGLYCIRSIHILIFCATRAQVSCKRRRRTLKVRQFQNEFMKSSFLPKCERKIVRISALCSVDRNLDNFLFVFWEKRWLHKLILKLTDLYAPLQ